MLLREDAAGIAEQIPVIHQKPQTLEAGMGLRGVPGQTGSIREGKGEIFVSWGWDGATKMQIEKREDGWWIVDTPEGVDECGPYNTKLEAEEDLRGIKRFLKEVENE